MSVSFVSSLRTLCIWLSWRYRRIRFISTSRILSLSDQTSALCKTIFRAIPLKNCLTSNSLFSMCCSDGIASVSHFLPSQIPDSHSPCSWSNLQSLPQEQMYFVLSEFIFSPHSTYSCFNSFTIHFRPSLSCK